MAFFMLCLPEALHADSERCRTYPGGRAPRQMTALGQKVRELRVTRGMTQQRLAEEAGVSHSLISALESGRRRYVSIEDVERLAKGLDVSSEEMWKQVPGGKREQRYIPLVSGAGGFTSASGR